MKFVCALQKDVLKKDGWSTNGQSDLLFQSHKLLLSKEILKHFNLKICIFLFF